MKPILLTIYLLYSLTTFGQQPAASEIQVIGRLIEHGNCDKVCTDTYEVIKTLKGVVTNDTYK